MNWRNTWLLVGIAGALFAFIWLFERHLTLDDGESAPKPLLAGIKPGTATSIELRKGTAFVISLERTNGTWRYTKPIRYPASTLGIQAFLDSLEQLIPTAYITPQEIVARKQTRGDFGMDGPGTLLTLKGLEGDDVILQFGARTPGGDQVYLDCRPKPGVYVVSAAILEQLPRTQDEWRDTALFPLFEQQVDRFEIARSLPVGGFTLQRDLTNRLWRMKSPSHRADQLKVEDLLKNVTDSRVLQFVSDPPNTMDLDSLGLQNPEVEVTIGSGGNVQKVQLGRSPTNDASRIFARQANTSNVVLVAKTILELLNKDYSELRERRLASFNPESVDSIEVAADETFTVKRQTNGAWTVAESPVDSAWVEAWLDSVSRMEVKQFVKDVVQDFTPYGLEPPKRQLTLRTSVTNNIGPTNALVARLDFGTDADNGTNYARRWDEYSVYAINPLDYIHLPSAAWQLRDHRIWNFSTNNVVRIAIRKGERTRQLVRQPNGVWADTAGDVNSPYAIEETIFRLGQLYAVAWVARGEAARKQYGFVDNIDQLSIDLKEGDKTRTVMVEFGGKSPLLYPYAAVTIDGQPWVFEFPWTIHADVQRYLSVPSAPGGL